MYFWIWVIVGLLCVGILGSIFGFNDDSSWITLVSVFWPIVLVVFIGYGMGTLAKWSILYFKK